MRALSLLIALTGCNRYDLWLVDDFRTGDWPPHVDVLVVMDGSRSMIPETAALGAELVAWTERLRAERAERTQEGLSDAVEHYRLDLMDAMVFADVQFAVTSIDMAEPGRLLGDPPLVNLDDPDFAERLQRNLLCEAACVSDLPEDPDYTCGDPGPSTLSRPFMDCLCGEGGWGQACAGDNEEGLEAVLQATCRAVDEPDEVCFDQPSLFGASDLGTNAGLIREPGVLIPVVITDEGDASRRTMAQDAIPDNYRADFVDLGVPMVWAIVGPEVDSRREPRCPGNATSWGTLRYEWMAGATGGIKLPIHDADCEPADFRQTLDRLVDMISGYRAGFPLRRPADPTTILVMVGGERVQASSEKQRDAYGFPDWGDGWTYSDDPPQVILHGAAIPQPHATVRVYYAPEPQDE